MQTDKGPVRGYSDNGMDVFLGIPFAAPPVGQLRWQPPQPAARWHKPLDAVAFADKCVQGDFGLFSTAGGSEDCLYLNVYTPKGASGRPFSSKHRSHRGHGNGGLKPVMVLIYGGGLRTGDTNSYDPSKLVKQGDVVFVSMGYRVNIFGFLAHPALDNEGHATSNYGIMDQQAALRWVQRNIRRFGGDPNRVTIFGESAGASSGLLQHNISDRARAVPACHHREHGMDRHRPQLCRRNCARAGIRRRGGMRQ